MNCAFTLNHVTEIIEQAKEDFALLTFQESERRNQQTKPAIFLRHDIDHSLEDAIVLAQLEKDSGIRSTYFVQLHSPFYTIMDARGRECLQMLCAMGHEVGFHYDISYYQTMGRPIVPGFKKDLALLGEIVGGEIKSAARHDPAAELLEDAVRRQLRESISHDAYDDEFFKQMKYISDSNCRWRSGCCCNHLDNPAPMHILIHPVWWVNDAPKWEDKLRQSVRRGMSRYSAMAEKTIAYYQSCLQDRASRDKLFPV